MAVQRGAGMRATAWYTARSTAPSSRTASAHADPYPDGRSSADDAQGQPRGTAALHQAGDLVPVDVVGIDLAQRPGDAELGEPCHASVVHEQVFVLCGLAAGDGWFHRWLLGGGPVPSLAK